MIPVGITPPDPSVVYLYYYYVTHKKLSKSAHFMDVCELDWRWMNNFHEKFRNDGKNNYYFHVYYYFHMCSQNN